MWALDHKESWVLKNWCFWTVVLEKTLESPLDCKEIKLPYPKGNQSWIFIGRTDAEAETPILWSPDVKKLLIRKDPDAGKNWRQEEKGITEDEMVGWHHRLNGHKFEQAPGDGQGSPVCCSPLGHKDLDVTEWLNWISSIRKGLLVATVLGFDQNRPPDKALGCDPREEKEGRSHRREGNNKGVKEILPSGQLGTLLWTHLREVQEKLLEIQILLPSPHQIH